jgi:hypothetical protein
MFIYNNIGGTFEENGTSDFSPTALTASAISYTDTTVLLTDQIDIDLVSSNSYALLNTGANQEIIKINSITLTSDGYELSFGRGCLDTVRKKHLSGVRIYFTDLFVGSDAVEYLDGETPTFKLITVTGQGPLPVDDATIISTTMESSVFNFIQPRSFRSEAYSYFLIK